MTGRNIALLMGGISAEREPSLASGRVCAEALKEADYRVRVIDAGPDLAETLREEKADAVFNALHGVWGEDGVVQGLLEWLRIPYTHSGVLASALAMNKEKAKTFFRAAGLPVAESFTASRREAARKHLMTPPYVAKPIGQGSSVGVYIVAEGQNSPPRALESEEWDYGEEIMLERYVPGQEITCAVLDGESLGVMELVPAKGFYDYSAKYDEGGARHVVPAALDSGLYHEIEDIACLAHKALGCRSITRADFRYDGETKRLVLLEINTQPGMTELSLVPELASHAGMTMPELTRWIVEDASCSR